MQHGIYNLAQKLLELPEQGISYYQKNSVTTRRYAEVYADVKNAEARLNSWGVEPNMRVGVLANNCYEWIVFELALLQMRCVTVCFPLEEFAHTRLENLAEKYRLHLLLISKAERSRRQDSSEWVAVLDGENERKVTSRRAFDDEIELDRDGFPLSPDVLTLIFSSGTSGKLKCLKIGKRGAEEWIAACGRSFSFSGDDRMIIALPFSNHQQRMLMYTAIWYGFNLLLVEPAQLFRAFKEMQPTLIAGPPMLYEDIENRFRTLSRFQQLLLSTVGRMINILTLEPLRSTLLRRWFKPFYDAFGGRMRVMLTGSAPSRKSTLELYALMGLPLYQVYGTGEVGMIALNLPGANRLGSVGKPAYEGAVTIADDGEIIVCHDCPVSLGYLYGGEEERSVYLGSNRIATGDIGRFDKHGYLYITGRKKEIIITQGGQKIQPEALEKELEKSPDVSRAVVYGGGELRGLVAVVSLRSEDNLRTKNGIQSAVDKLNSMIPSASRINRLVFTTVQFRADNGFLTRNLKTDRNAIFEAFKESLIGER